MGHPHGWLGYRLHPCYQNKFLEKSVDQEQRLQFVVTLDRFVELLDRIVHFDRSGGGLTALPSVEASIHPLVLNIRQK